MIKKCKDCPNDATWRLESGKEEDVYCDFCVPRGCICNRYHKDERKSWADAVRNGPHIIYGDYFEPLDESGRRFPCIEYAVLEREEYANR